MALPFSFSNNTNPTGPQLDACLAALGTGIVIPCVLTGTNTLTLTPLPGYPTVVAYFQGQLYFGVAAASNTGGVTATVGAVGALNVYKDTAAGPVALVGGEIVGANAVYLAYDIDLNSGSGGFHLLNPAQVQSLSAVNSVTAGSGTTGTTLTAAVLTGNSTGQGIITRGGTFSGGYNDATDTATAIVGAFSAPVVGSTFRFRVVNTSGQTQTITAGSGVTVTGTATTANNASHDYIGRITNVGTPAVVIYA